MQRLDLVDEEVVLFTQDLRIEGTIHMEPGRARFSDTWESFLRERRAYMPVTGATIHYRHGGRPAESVDSFFLERTDVRAIFRRGPDEDVRGGSGASRIDRASVEAGILCETLRVEGTIHLDPSRGRFSEAWEALIKDSRTCVPITDARIMDRAGGEPLAETGFVSVDKGDILCGYPLAGDGHEPAPTRYLQLEKMVTSMVLDGVVVTGTIHARPGEANFSRFSDLWDAIVRDPRTFVPVTDAEIQTLEGETVVKHAGFLCVEKAHVRAAYPPSEG